MRYNEYGQQAVLEILQSFNEHYKKRYCYPAQQTILQVLKKRYSLRICTRMLNYWLRDLEDAGWINRLRRLRRGITGKLEFWTTLYKLTSKTMKLIYRKANQMLKLTGKFFKENFGKSPKATKTRVQQEIDDPERGSFRPNFSELETILT